jgi:hypothetical protein
MTNTDINDSLTTGAALNKKATLVVFMRVYCQVKKPDLHDGSNLTLSEVLAP